MGLAAGLNFFSYVDNNPVLYGDPSGLCPQKSLDVYDRCSKLAPEISLGAYLYIRDTLKDENVDPTLLAVTWANEGSFRTRPENNQNSQREGDVDIGPMQINYRQWANWSGFQGLPLGVDGVFGNSLLGRQEFNGSVLTNLRAGARILNEELRASNGNRADAAGYYTSGRGQYVKTPPGQRDFRHRRDSFNRLQRAFDKFFECVGLR